MRDEEILGVVLALHASGCEHPAARQAALFISEPRSRRHHVRVESYPRRDVKHDVPCPSCENQYDRLNPCAQCGDAGWIRLDECSCRRCVEAWARLCHKTPDEMAELMDAGEPCACGCGEAPGTALEARR